MRHTALASAFLALAITGCNESQSPNTIINSTIQWPATLTTQLNNGVISIETMGVSYITAGEVKSHSPLLGDLVTLSRSNADKLASLNKDNFSDTGLFDAVDNSLLSYGEDTYEASVKWEEKFPIIDKFYSDKYNQVQSELYDNEEKIYEFKTYVSKPMDDIRLVQEQISKTDENSVAYITLNSKLNNLKLDLAIAEKKAESAVGTIGSLEANVQLANSKLDKANEARQKATGTAARLTFLTMETTDTRRELSLASDQYVLTKTTTLFANDFGEALPRYNEAFELDKSQGEYAFFNFKVDVTNPNGTAYYIGLIVPMENKEPGHPLVINGRDYMLSTTSDVASIVYSESLKKLAKL